MEIKVLLGIIAVACEIVAGLLYYRGIWLGQTKPHLYTMAVWSMVTGITFAGIVVGGGEAGAWATGLVFLHILSVALISLKWGTTDITPLDKWFLAAALFAILPWVLTHNPLWSVILASIIDACGIIPTLRKTWNTPSTEPLVAWILGSFRGVFQIAALSVYSPITLIYLVEVLVVDLILVGIIVYRRYHARITL